MTTSREIMAEIAPKLAELTSDVVFGDVWERSELSKRDRSLITVAVLTALYRTDQLRGHIGRALDNGVTKDEIAESDSPHGLLRRLAHRRQRRPRRQRGLRRALASHNVPSPSTRGKVRERVSEIPSPPRGRGLG